MAFWLQPPWPVELFEYILRRTAIGVMDDCGISEEDAQQAVLRTWLALMPVEGSA